MNQFVLRFGSIAIIGIVYLLLSSFGINHPKSPNPLVEELTIEINIQNIRNSEGNLLISLYTPEDNFPTEPSQVFTINKNDISDHLTHSLTIAQQGKFAVVLLDDENENQDMDYNFLGIPKEGYGFSNNAKPRGLSAPKFEAAAFDVNESGAQLEIKMNYML